MGRLDTLVAATLPEAPELVTPGDLGDELASFTRAMRATNVSPNTISAYGGAVRQFGRWLMEHDYPTTVAEIEARHIEEWIGELLERNKPATAGLVFPPRARPGQADRPLGRVPARARAAGRVQERQP
jgi:hypothetical protein